MLISINFNFIFDVLRYACPSACDPYLGSAQAFAEHHLILTACANVAATALVGKIITSERVRRTVTRGRAFLAGSLMRESPTTLFADKQS